MQHKPKSCTFDVAAAAALYRGRSGAIRRAAARARSKAPRLNYVPPAPPKDTRMSRWLLGLPT